MEEKVAIKKLLEFAERPSCDNNTDHAPNMTQEPSFQNNTVSFSFMCHVFIHFNTSLLVSLYLFLYMFFVYTHIIYTIFLDKSDMCVCVKQIFSQYTFELLSGLLLT